MPISAAGFVPHDKIDPVWCRPAAAAAAAAARCVQFVCTRDLAHQAAPAVNKFRSDRGRATGVYAVPVRAVTAPASGGCHPLH